MEEDKLMVCAAKLTFIRDSIIKPENYEKLTEDGKKGLTVIFNDIIKTLEEEAKASRRLG